MSKSKIPTSESKEKAKNKGFEPTSSDFENKIRFSLWLKPQTMTDIDDWFIKDNCRSKSEFIEAAISFYIGYLKKSANINYLAPIITDSVNGIVLGSERRMNRNLFKIAVELGKLSHMMAAVNDIDEETLREPDR